MCARRSIKPIRPAIGVWTLSDIASASNLDGMDEPRFLSGQLLLAMPGMEDPRFEKAVIALCSHDEQGAMGIGLGRIIPRIHFHDLLSQFDIPSGSSPDVPIHLGVPVETHRGFILHSPDWACDESLY